VKGSIRKIVGKLRRQESKNASPPQQKTRGARSRRPKAGAEVTGQTVFHDRPLNLRSLTVTEVDIPTIQNPVAIEGGAFKIRVAKRSRTRRDATTLVRDRYATRGYDVPFAGDRPRVFTFIAYDEGQVVGTVSVGMDSSEGLFADGLYRAEIDRMRAAGARICEFKRLAVDRSTASKRILAGLFHTAYLFACKIRGCSHAVIEVNPRHVLFYGKELKFEVLGPERMDPRVNAPAVLLCVSFAAIADGLEKHAGKHVHAGSKRTLFHYGFPPKEELGVLHRLTELVFQHGGWGP
jgi:N-acyl amino acid synthase FeeM